jgi:hypothetical protein
MTQEPNCLNQRLDNVRIYDEANLLARLECCPGQAFWSKCGEDARSRTQGVFVQQTISYQIPSRKLRCCLAFMSFATYVSTAQLIRSKDKFVPSTASTRSAHQYKVSLWPRTCSSGWDGASTP